MEGTTMRRLWSIIYDERRYTSEVFRDPVVFRFDKIEPKSKDARLVYRGRKNIKYYFPRWRCNDTFIIDRTEHLRP